MELVPKGKSSGGVISSVMGFFKNTFGGGSKGPRQVPCSRPPASLNTFAWHGPPDSPSVYAHQMSAKQCKSLSAGRHGDRR